MLHPLFRDGRCCLAEADEIESEHRQPWESDLPERSDPVMGWGKCSVSGCPCAEFKQTYGSELCNNCGHKYTDHW